MAYRIILIGGPEDGLSLIVNNPWHACWPNNNLYEAERGEDGSVLKEEGDQGDSIVEAVTEDGCYTPRIQTIKMYWTGKKHE